MMLRRFIYLFSALLLISVPVQAADRVALVIGNGTYVKVPTLPNPTRDAADVGKALERLNFKVTQLSNASAAEMRRAELNLEPDAIKPKDLSRSTGGLRAFVSGARRNLGYLASQVSNPKMAINAARISKLTALMHSGHGNEDDRSKDA